MTELKSCPFCGAPAEKVFRSQPYPSATIRCRDCRAETAMYDAAKLAIDAWNIRAIGALAKGEAELRREMLDALKIAAGLTNHPTILAAFKRAQSHISPSPSDTGETA